MTLARPVMSAREGYEVRAINMAERRRTVRRMLGLNTLQENITRRIIPASTLKRLSHEWEFINGLVKVVGSGDGCIENIPASRVTGVATKRVQISLYQDALNHRTSPEQIAKSCAHHVPCTNHYRKGKQGKAKYYKDLVGTRLSI
jgi:hypothetical protein